MMNRRAFLKATVATLPAVTLGFCQNDRTQDAGARNPRYQLSTKTTVPVLANVDAYQTDFGVVKVVPSAWKT